LLERRLPQHLLLNRGRAGDTVADLRARLQYEGLEPVDAAFVWVGANDAVIGAWDASDSGSGWSWDERLERLRGDYEELLEWTAARAPRLVLVQPIILEADGSLWEARAAEIGGTLRELAAARSACRVLDLGPAFAVARASGAGPFTTDGVHFTDAGAEVVADAFAAVIAELDVGAADTPSDDVPADDAPPSRADPRRPDQEARS
jgi:lysophospholipase L1-like esterase